MLLYVHQYCIASVAVTGLLLFMYGMKRNYNTHRNRIFFWMLIDNLLASSVNIITFYTISFPERFHPVFSFIINALYLFLYNMMGVLFMLYVDSMTKITRVLKPVKYLAMTIAGYLVIVLGTSCFTHWVIYFDENGTYSHGPLNFTLYITAFITVFTSLALFFRRRHMFNSYQTLAVAGFVIGIFAGVIYQIFHPSQVISNFICSLVLMFLYTAFENQAYHLYGDTPCYNRSAFVQTIHRLMKNDSDYTLYALRIENYDSTLRSQGISVAQAMSMRAAERLSKRFGKNAYCLNPERFVVIDLQGEGRAYMISELKKCFDLPVVTHIEGVHTKYDVVATIAVLPVNGGGVEGYEADAIVQSLDGEFSVLGTAVDDVDKRLRKLRRERQLISRIDRAIRNREFQVYYQPIYDVATGKYKSAEALIRLKDENEGFISPEEFIPVSERSGRILEIGDIVLREVCRFMKEEGLEQYGVEYVEVNLSPVQCRERFMSDRLVRIMTEAGIEPSRINLEITESGADLVGQGMATLEELLVSLHDKGVTFSIDDFGSGFAAVDYLLNLPVDIVKIDKSILWQAFKDKTSMGVLVDTMQMIKRVGRDIVVEGVETKEMVDLLAQNGCDHMQGYYFSKPVSQEEYLKFLQNI